MITRDLNTECCGFKASEAVAGLVLLVGLAECVMGWLQLLGVINSGHQLYPATGTFFNPGPYCAFLAVIMPVALAGAMRSSHRLHRYVCLTYLILTAGIMPVLMGRTGWLGAIAGCAVTYIGCRKKRIRVPVSAAVLLTSVLIAGCIGLYCLKPDSAMGRLLIWESGVRAMLMEPLAGWGWDNVPGALGQVQQDYFALHPDSPYAAVAGSPEYAFNEYLQVGIAFGIPAMLLFVATTIWIIRLAWRKNAYGYAGFFVAFAFVCLSSYPLQFNEFIISVTLMALPVLSQARAKLPATTACLAVVVIASAAVSHTLRRNNAKENWLGIRPAYIYGVDDSDIARLDSMMRTTQCHNTAFLFDYGKALRQTGLYDKSNTVLAEGLKYSSDPMFLNLIGRNHEDLGEHDKSDEYYVMSMNRLPGRLYPLYLRVKLHANDSDKTLFNELSLKLIEMKPKVESPATRQMKEEIMNGRMGND